MKSWDEFWREHKISEAEHYYIKKRHEILEKSVNVGRILEVGCGSGSNSKMLSDMGNKCFCLDLSINAVKRYGGFGVVCDARRMGIKDKIFDISFSAGLLEHFPNVEDSQAIVSEMFRITKNNGTVVNFVPGRYSLWQIYRKIHGKNWVHGFERTFSYDEFKKLHEAHEVLEMGGFDPFSVKGLLIKLTRISDFERLPELSLRNCFSEIFVVSKRR